MGVVRETGNSDIADMIVIAFFFLLRPDECTGMYSDDAAFKIQDVSLYIQERCLDILSATDRELEVATSTSYVFTRQKNGHRNEKVVHRSSGDPLCCPVKATVPRMQHHWSNGAKPTAPIDAHCRGHRRTAIAVKDVMDVIRHVMKINYSKTGIHALEISARSLRADGSMAMLCGRIDIDIIRIMVCWHSDTMIRYLHIQAPPIINNYSASIFNHGTYAFLPDETVPIIDVNGDN
jgi:hypothetical protein